MAITISGSTGIVEANIADSAITTAKIANGTIATGDLASGAITQSILPTGSVLQVVTGVSGASRTQTTSTSPVDYVTATITPRSATSKILVIGNLAGLGRAVSNNNAYIGARITRNSTEILLIESQACYQSDNSLNEISVGGTGGTVLDSPATTSAITYRLQLWNTSGGGGNVWTDRQNTITLMEIAG
jgi:hypothetical protein